MNGTEHSDSSAQPLNQESRDKPPIRTKTIGAFTLEEIQEEDSGGWNPKNLVGKVKQEVESLRRTTPYTLKLLAESIAVAPKRTLMVMVGTFARNLVPSVSLKLNSDLIKAVSSRLPTDLPSRIEASHILSFCLASSKNQDIPSSCCCASPPRVLIILGPFLIPSLFLYLCRLLMQQKRR